MHPSAGAASVRFAPLGLSRMMNGGAAVLGCSHAAARDQQTASVTVQVRGRGAFLAYSSAPPAAAHLNGAAAAFQYDAAEGRLVLDMGDVANLTAQLTFTYNL